MASSSFTASTSYAEFVPSAGRLNGPTSWCSQGDVAGQEFLQIYVPEAEVICAIAIQGTGYERGDEHVTQYFLEYSKNDFDWQVIEEDGNLKVLFDFKVFLHSSFSLLLLLLLLLLVCLYKDVTVLLLLMMIT